MRTDKALAVKLRLRGESYGQIQKRLRGISKATLSAWLRNMVLSPSAQGRILARTRQKSLEGLLKRNKRQTASAKSRKEKIMGLAQMEIGRFSREILLYLGAALYWAEGYKRPIVRNGRETTYHPVSITNSDPALIRLFIRFIQEVCAVPIEKVKASVRIFKHLNENEVIRYWMHHTNLPRKNFTKTMIPISRSSMNKRPFNRLPFGVIQIRISDTNLFHRIMGWIEGIKRSTIT